MGLHARVLILRLHLRGCNFGCARAGMIQAPRLFPLGLRELVHFPARRLSLKVHRLVSVFVLVCRSSWPGPCRAPQVRCLGHPKMPTPDDAECVVVSGVFQKHLSCLVRAAKQFKFAGLDSDTLHTYTGMWNWPLALASRSAHPGDAFNPKRAASSWEAGTFKCQASEALGLVPVFHRLMPKHNGVQPWEPFHVRGPNNGYSHTISIPETKGLSSNYFTSQMSTTCVRITSWCHMVFGRRAERAFVVAFSGSRFSCDVPNAGSSVPGRRDPRLAPHVLRRPRARD